MTKVDISKLFVSDFERVGLPFLNRHFISTVYWVHLGIKLHLMDFVNMREMRTPATGVK